MAHEEPHVAKTEETRIAEETHKARKKLPSATAKTVAEKLSQPVEAKVCNVSGEHQKQDWPTHKLLCKLVRSDSDIQAAVSMWCSDPTRALKKYGHISEWNTFSVTTMEQLFLEKSEFNDGISKWNVSNVTDMEAMFRDTPFNGDLWMECQQCY